MAWTAARTWVASEIVSASIMNTHIRDNLNAIRASCRWTTTATNNASMTSVTPTAITWDDFGTASTSLAYVTVPWAGRFEVLAGAIVSGQSGTGNGAIQVLRHNSSGVLQETINRQDGGSLNQSVFSGGMANFAANDRVVVQSTNGATGTAGSLAITCSIRAAG